MKPFLSLALIILFSAFASCKSPQQASGSQHAVTDSQAVVYVCPMHPDVTSNKPGKCPKCGMELEKKNK